MIQTSKCSPALLVLLALGAAGCAPGDRDIAGPTGDAVLAESKADAPGRNKLDQRNFTAHLSDEAGTGSRAQGQAVFHFDATGDNLDYRLIVANLDDVFMAHIHVAAAPGGNGPVVAWLYPDAPPGIPLPGTTNGVLAVGTVDVTDLTGSAGVTTMAALRSAILAGRAYVNVHTAAFRAGEIRGTIQ